MLISRTFSSIQNRWRLLVDIENDLTISLYLTEAERLLPSTTQPHFNYSFASTVFVLSIQDQKNEVDGLFMYSFPCGEYHAIGHRHMYTLRNLSNQAPHELTLKVWIQEVTIHTAALHYLAAKFGDILQTEEVKLDSLKEGNEGLRHQFLSRKGHTSQLTKASGQLLMDRSEAYADGQSRSARKAPSFYDIGVFDVYSILSSNDLNIEDERFAFIYLYRYFLKQHNEEHIAFILHTVRFENIELKSLLNMARDHAAVRDNEYFKQVLRYEIDKRMTGITGQRRRSRNYYSEDSREPTQPFKEELLKWLIEVDHHDGFKNKIEELKRIIRDKEESLKQLQRKYADIAVLSNTKQSIQVVAPPAAEKRASAKEEDVLLQYQRRRDPKQVQLQGVRNEGAYRPTTNAQSTIAPDFNSDIFINLSRRCNIF
jgi:hypothetical protein